MSDDQALIADIQRLKREKNAVILAHNYQRPAVQDIGDFTGDSLGLSRQAARTGAEVIVFCGVHFMAQTAKLLSPEKLVLLPELEAGCPMADMITAEQLRQFKGQHPGAPVVAYVNTSAEVKAESDICCTSANAVEVVRSLEEDKVLFVPDRNLGRWVQKQVPEKEVILYQGFCPTHELITAGMVRELRRQHPQAAVMAHPECNEETLELADAVKSTSGMLKYAKQSDAREFIVVTELGIIHPLEKENPEKRFHAVFDAVCPNMKLTTLESVKRSLEESIHQIEIAPEIAEKARRSVERMVEIG